MTSDHARKKAIRARMTASGEPYSVAARALAARALAASAPAADAESVADRERGADPAGALAEVIACAGRTLTAVSARVEVRADTDLGWDPERVPRRRPGLVGRLAGRAAKGVWARIAPDTDPAELREQFLHQFGEGFLEPAADRYLIDYGGWSQVLIDGRRFSGLSGEPLGPRYENGPGRSRRDDPLDGLRRLQGATAARWVGAETIRGTPCRLAATTAGQDEFTVWIDGERIRRFQTVERGSGRSARATKTETVELWDFGLPVDELDWSRLPSFRASR
jgi:hypothetical protein